MRLVIIIMTTCLMQVSAAGFAQRLTYAKKNTTLAQVFAEIKKQTGYKVLYSDQKVDDSKRINASFKDSPLEEVLEACLKNQPLSYEIDQKTILIKGKEPSFLDNIIARFQTINVHGRVVDKNGEPLPGATIKVKGTTTATTSDEKGNFYLPKVDNDAFLVVTFIGFTPIEIAANSDLTAIKLNDVDSKLNEVQIIAYGTTSKKFSTSNIGTVTSKEIGNQPVSNPLLTLQGRVPGLFVNQQSGVTASGIDVNVQGLNSLRANANGPFYVIDGVPYNPSLPGGDLMGGAIASGMLGSSTFNFINPANIESISILKDADATAIYGSRAANGAILITTKKGKAGKTIVDFNIRNGWGQIDHKLNMMNTQEYLALRKEAYTNAGVKIPTTAAEYNSTNPDLTVWDQTKYTDWQKELVGGIAKFTDVTASVSGGTENTQFLVGYNYNKQTTVYRDNKADIKGDVHLNINHSSKDNRFKYFFTATYLQDKNELNNTDLMAVALTLAPNTIDLRNPDGSINFGLVPGRVNTASLSTNPLINTLKKFTGNTSNLIANNNISYQILPGLQLKSNLGYTKLETNQTTIVPITVYTPYNPTKTRSARYLTNNASTWIIEPQITYFKESKIGRFDFLVGGTFQQTKNDALMQSGSGYSSDSKLENLQAAATVTVNSVYQSLYKYNALFGRLNYQLHDKYVLNITARRDGSSRFGVNKQFSTFYAVGGAWLFGDEKFIKNNFSWVTSGKLRASYGITGNDQIADYGYLSTLDIYGVDIPYQNVNGLFPTILSNPYLQWEETRKINFGIDLGFLQNRLTLTADIYRNRSSNQLIPTNLPYTTGFGDTQQNFPATLQNTGLEAVINAHIIKTSKFNWHFSANFTKNKNKLIEFKDLELSPYASNLIIGRPINILHVYKYAGVNPTTGLYEVYNNKGERTSTPDPIADKSTILDLNPKWYGGLINTVSYKNVELEFIFQYVSQNAENFRFGNNPGTIVSNQPESLVNRWQKLGDIKDVQRVSTLSGQYSQAFSAALNSDARYSDGSYLRLKNVSLSYSVDKQFLDRFNISSARIYFQGQNLLTITKFIGTDPETKSLLRLPPLRVFTVGLQVGI